MSEATRFGGPVILDTCAWIWLVDGHARLLRSSHREDIEAAALEGRLLLSPISKWEVATKVAKGKMALSLPVLEWIREGKGRSRIRDAPLSDEIAVESANLPEELGGDPADRLVVATARVLGGAIVTGDQRIVAYGRQRLVRVWRV